MPDLEKGGMTQPQKKRYIINSLDDLTPDVLEAIYKLVFYAEIGLE